MDTSRRLPPLEVWGEYNVFKVLLRSNSQYPYFLYFRVSMTCQISIHYDYQKSFFFFYFYFREVAVVISLSRSNYSLVEN